MTDVSRRKFLIGGSAVVATAAIAVSTSMFADQKGSGNSAGTAVPPAPRFDDTVDPATWFDKPKMVAAVGAAPLGVTIKGNGESTKANMLKTADEYAAAVAEEQGIGTLLQTGGWFLTPTEVAVAQRIHRNTA